MNIPFHKPMYDASDEMALAGALRSGHIVGDGPATLRAAAALKTLFGVRHVLLTTSCTHALELAVLASGIGPDDEVIVPSFTFVSTPNCVMRGGARVRFADISPDTLTLDPQEVVRRSTARTKAVIPVAYAGVSPDMDAILAIARARHLIVIEDAAQSVDAGYRERHAGTQGDIGCFSFHETKNLSTGEGGAFITERDDIALRADIIREKGTNRKQFLLGLVDKYTWVDVGSSYLPPDTMAAVLLTQLDKRDMIHRRRKAIHERYVEEFSALADGGRLALPVIPDYARSNYHLFYILLESEDVRNKALAFFRERGVGTTFHYLPLHLSKVGRDLGYGPGDFPVTESVSGRLLRLPIYPALSDEEQSVVVATMREFLHTQ
jgi:dTDP-4-amino-4,6-dideoxygalactose transaminase